MDGERLSVIVPCYNIEKYIERTVQSILAQSYKNIEIILVDDGSTDGTSNIINRLAIDNPYVCAYHKRNGGVSSARLLGIQKATGKWVAFVDGDDLLKPEMYLNLIMIATEYNADISHCGYEMVFPDHIDPYYGTGKIVVQNNVEGLRDLLTGEYIEPSLCNKVYRRKIIMEAWEECKASYQIHNMEDLLWNYYFFKRTKTSVYIDECYYQYVLRKGSAVTSRLNRHKLLDPYHVFNIIERDLKGFPEIIEIVQGRKASILISIATNKKNEEDKWIKQSSEKARIIIRRNLFNYLSKDFSFRLKVRLLLIAFSPNVYGIIYELYSKIRGTENKYAI